MATPFAIYDCHAHLADARILRDGAAILARSRAHGVCGVLATAARHDEWPAIIALTREPGVVGALGLHPFFPAAWTAALASELRRHLLAEPRLRAIGEIGLDCWSGRKNLDRQLVMLEAQLAVASELRKPVVLHNRRSWNEFFARWCRLQPPPPGGVLHHFTGSREIARQALDLGLHLSFGGPLTWPGARRLKEVAAWAPLDRVLTETDTPDLPAEPFRGGRSEPWQVGAVVTELARLKQQPPEAVAAAVAANFLRLFGAC
ncbi:MAG: TatD family hydrolase [bacterium]